MTKINFVFLFLLSVLFSFGCSTVDIQKSETVAIESARVWLSMIDSGKYEESWNESAEVFRNAVTVGKWQKSIDTVRKPLGTLISRKVKSKEYRTSLPGAPNGKYVVIQFSTSFTKKDSAIETVTPMIDKDGEWRVSGYYIK
ncbi:MAG: DUF4019 domain-containing protein [Deltaproteobacteria bacterium]|jgi:hypothetical protein|nr:DUF4019 domain-containing protein [Deltaproteobacteria bacterium]MBT4643194.1 DUF4019 domain-containing protein [Deltaproteobacteria bacterium]